ncbi:hypothetical protein P8452_13687 [Trifolium repens]|nr:hypothetical protein P8452_13687 [Trifolium repens]
MYMNKYVLVPSHSEDNPMQVSYPKNAGDDDTMNFSPTAPNVCNEPVHDEAQVTEPLMTHGSVKEVTLADIMDAIKVEIKLN